MFSKVLVANRGEIAVRVIRALDELGIASVAVYSEADRDAQHVKRAGEAYLLGPGPAAESYLNVDKLLEVIEASGAEAVHPGYGFLAENAAFAKRLEDAGVDVHRPARVGDRGDGLQDAGARADAERRRADRARHDRAGRDASRTRAKIAEDIGYPIAVKAAGGGGGKGFRVALEPDKLKDAFEGAAREGEKFFSDATVYLERYLPDPRHVEVQVLADKHGTVVHLGERDCSIQRRHQKLIEESPAPLVDEELRERIGKIATDAAEPWATTARARSRGCSGRRVLLPRDEHARPGRALRDRGDDGRRHRARADPDRRGRGAVVRPGRRALHGHAIECRINAEDASKNFAPAPGTDQRTTASRPAPACGSTPACSPARRSRRSTTRWSRS